MPSVALALGVGGAALGKSVGVVSVEVDSALDFVAFGIVDVSVSSLLRDLAGAEIGVFDESQSVNVDRRDHKVFILS